MRMCAFVVAQSTFVDPEKFIFFSTKSAISLRKTLLRDLYKHVDTHLKKTSESRCGCVCGQRAARERINFSCFRDVCILSGENIYLFLHWLTKLLIIALNRFKNLIKRAKCCKLVLWAESRLSLESQMSRGCVLITVKTLFYDSTNMFIIRKPRKNRRSTSYL